MLKVKVLPVAVDMKKENRKKERKKKNDITGNLQKTQIKNKPMKNVQLRQEPGKNN